MTQFKYSCLLLSAIGFCLVLMSLIDDNLYIKAILGLVILGTVCLIKCIWSAVELPPDINPDTMEEIEPAKKDETVNDMQQEQELGHEDNIDIYLRLMIEVSEELAKEGIVKPDSPSYNLHLNHRISERL